MQTNGKRVNDQAPHKKRINDAFPGWQGPLPSARSRDSEWRKFLRHCKVTIEPGVAPFKTQADADSLFWLWYNSAPRPATRWLATTQIGFFNSCNLVCMKATAADFAADFAADSRGRRKQWRDRSPKKEKAPWLVADLIPAGQCFLIYGPPKTGKTLLALELALCIATGRPWQGRPTVQGKVFYILGEGGPEFESRVEAWLAALPNGERDAARKALDSNLAWRDAGVALNNPAAVAEFIETELDGDESLVVADCLLRCFEGDTSNGAAMSAFVKGIDALRDSGSAVLILHHAGKDLGRGSLGSVGLPAAVDGIARFIKRADGTRVFAVEAMRDASENQPPLFFAVRPVEGSAVLERVEPATAGKLRTVGRVLLAVRDGKRTLRDVAAAVGLASVSTAAKHRAALIADGLLSADGAELTNKGRELVARIEAGGDD